MGTEEIDRAPPGGDNGLGVVLKGLAPGDLLEPAQEAERKRFTSAWFAEITFGDAVTPAAAAAARTQRLLLVPSIIGIWSRSRARSSR